MTRSNETTGGINESMNVHDSSLSVGQTLLLASNTKEGEKKRRERKNKRNDVKAKTDLV